MRIRNRISARQVSQQEMVRREAANVEQSGRTIYDAKMQLREPRKYYQRYYDYLSNESIYTGLLLLREQRCA